MTEVVNAQEAEYQKSYYLQHREKLLKKKADRYRKNPEYREAAILRSAERKKRLRLEGASDTGGRKKGPTKPKIFNVPMGKVSLTTTMMSAGQVAQKLGRKTQTIRLWEKKGILPPAMYRDPKTGARLYTEDQVTALVKAFHDAEKAFGDLVETRISRTSFPEAAQEIWRQWPAGIAVS